MVSITKNIYCGTTQCRLLMLSSILNFVKVVLALIAIVILDRMSFDISLQIRTVLIGWLLCSVVVNGIQSIWQACAAFFPDSVLLRYLSLSPCLAMVVFIVSNGCVSMDELSAFTLGSILYAIMVAYSHARDFILTHLVEHGYAECRD